MTINKDTMKELRKDIDEALKVIAQKHELKKLELGSGRYDEFSGTFSFKLEGIAKDGRSEEEEAYEIAAKMYKLPPLESEFVYNHRVFIVKGWNSRSRKFPVIVEEKFSHKKLAFTKDAVLNSAKR